MTLPKPTAPRPTLRDTFAEAQPAVLVRAIDHGASTKKIMRLLQDGANPHMTDAAGRTPVDAAMAQGAYDTVLQLMAHGAAPPPYDGDPNGAPVYSGDNQTFREEIARQTALTYFIQRGNSYPTIFTLLCNGADVNLADKNGITPLQAAVDRGWPYVAMQLVKAGAWKDPENPQADEIVDKHTGMTRLMLVILEGRDGLAVKKLLQQGADPNKADHNGITPLALARAIHWGYAEEQLIAHGAKENTFPDPNQMCGDKTLLGYALSYQACHPNYIYGLLDAGADPDMADDTGKTALHWAAVFSRTDIFKEMCAMGADLDKTDKHGLKPLHYACMNGSTDIVSTILDQTQGAEINTPVGETARTPLMMAAARHGAYDLVRMLIHRGAFINAQSLRAETALSEAVSSRDPAMIKLLIDNGADVAKHPEPPAKDGLPGNILHYNPPLFSLVNAHNDKNIEIAKILLDAGADPNDVAIESFNGPQKGDSLLYFAVSYRAHALAALLLASGADPHSTSHNGATAMHYCLQLRNVDGVRLLLENGFDPQRHFDYTQTWSNGTIDRHTGSCLDAAGKLVEKFGADSEYGQMHRLIENHIAAKPAAAEAKKPRAKSPKNN